jgi:hypothetical protein
MAIRRRALIACHSQKPVSTLSDLERRRASARRRRVAFDCEVRANRPTGLGKMTLRRDRSAWNAKRRKRYTEDLEHRERRKAQHRAYYAVHKEQIKERQRRRSWAKKLSDFWRRLARFYGISREQYEGLLAKQGGVCGICRKPPQEPLCVDHSHATGRVRGLLCRKCNTGLGSYDDDVSLMAAGIAYLRKAADDEANVAASAGAATPD